MPAVTNTEAANQEKKLSSRLSQVRCLTGLLRGGGGNKGLVYQHSAAASVSRELASTLDERGWSSSGVAAWIRPRSSAWSWPDLAKASGSCGGLSAGDGRQVSMKLERASLVQNPKCLG